MEILDELELFVVLAEEGSLAAVSRRLRIPRPTLSRRLARFESQLGVKLIERTTRTSQLTEAGRVLYERGRPLLTLAEQITEEVRQVDGVARGPLVIGIQTGLGRGFMGAFVERMLARCPEVELYMHFSPQPLADREKDIVLAEGPLPDSDWVAVHLAQSDRLALASPTYLQAHGSPRSLAELTQHRLLSPVDGPNRSVLWPCRDGAEVPVAVTVASDDLDTLLECAVGGQGIALLPFTVAAAAIARGELLPVLPQTLGRAAEFFALYPPHRRSSPKIRAFLEVAEAFIEEARAGAITAVTQE